MPKQIASKEEQQNKENEKLELPASATQVDQDLALSADTSDEEGCADAYVIDTDLEKELDLDDVEPDDMAEEIATRESRKAEQPQIPEDLVPEILVEFQDTVVISDEAESTTDVAPSTTDAGPVPSTSAPPVPSSAGKSTPPEPSSAGKSAPSSARKSSSTTSIDVTARKPMRPSKPHISVRKLRTTVPQPQIIPRPPEIVQQARRRLKIVTSLHMANASINYHKSTDELAEGFACSYSLNQQERFNVRRDMRKMRLYRPQSSHLTHACQVSSKLQV